MQQNKAANLLQERAYNVHADQQTGGLRPVKDHPGKVSNPQPPRHQGFASLDEARVNGGPGLYARPHRTLLEPVFPGVQIQADAAASVDGHALHGLPFPKGPDCLALPVLELASHGKLSDYVGSCATGKSQALARLESVLHRRKVPTHFASVLKDERHWHDSHFMEVG